MAVMEKEGVNPWSTSVGNTVLYGLGNIKFAYLDLALASVANQSTTF